MKTGVASKETLVNAERHENKKIFVVWTGRQPGIYESWADCQTQINGFHNARHKSFPTRHLIVHALAHCKKHSLTVPIYSDSRNAINWVKDRHARTRQERTEKNKKIFDLLDRAIRWLHENEYLNPILKWETKAWGENPADFGRK